MTRRALILRNPRATGGPLRHREGWRALLAALDYETVELEPEPGWRTIWGHVRQLTPILSGTSVPESIVWPRGVVADAVRDHRPDVVIVHTLRSCVPELEQLGVPVIVDYVDQLSESYRQRAHISSRTRRPLFLAMAASHRRVESARRGDAQLAVGANDARQLDAQWVPVIPTGTATASSVPFADRPHDAVFFGSLNYEPNVEALRWLDSTDTTDLDLLVAGRRATPEVRAIVAENGWTLKDGFDSVGELADLARVAIAPLRSATGIQTKIFDAALIGLAQVVTPPALAGFGTPIPAVVEETIAEVVQSAHELARSRERAESLAAAALEVVTSAYSIEQWAPIVDQILERAIAGSSATSAPQPLPEVA